MTQVGSGDPGQARNMDLSICIVSTDERAYLKRCLDHLLMSSLDKLDYEIIVIDNRSSDGTSEMIENGFKDVKLIKNSEKSGFSRNLNTLISNSRGDSILIIDANAYVTKDYAAILLRAMDKLDKAGILSGKLLKYDGNGVPLKGATGKNVIDSAGHLLRRDRRVTNRGENEEDNGQFDMSEEVFGVCTAATLLKRGMLEDIKLFGEYFDGSFFSHKEDVDMCWRARHKGWRCYYVHDAVAFHARSWPSGRARKSIPEKIRIDSLKNRYLLMLKNEYLINYLLAFPFILFYEIKMWGYILLFERFLLRAGYEVLKLLPLTISKRKMILTGSKLRPKEIRKWAV